MVSEILITLHPRGVGRTVPVPSTWTHRRARPEPDVAGPGRRRVGRLPRRRIIGAVPLYINRFSRRRHVDPQCRAIHLSNEMVGQLGPSPLARILEIPDSADPSEMDAIRDFTYPCIWCVPGARESWDARPIEFESRDELDPGVDWTGVLIVVRNEPSALRDGRFRIVGRTRDGEEVIVNEGGLAIRPGTLLWLDASEGRD